MPEQNSSDLVTKNFVLDLVVGSLTSRFGLLQRFSPLSFIWLPSACALTGLSLVDVHISDVFVYMCSNFFFHKDSDNHLARTYLNEIIYLNYFSECPISTYSHSMRYQGLGFQHRNFRGIIESIIGPQTKIPGFLFCFVFIFKFQ